MKEFQDYALAAKIQKAYIERCAQEKNKVRVSNLIYDAPSLVTRRSDSDFSSYLKTYWHDTLKDVVCCIFLKEGFIPYKEEFLLNNGIKGHDDITLYNVDIIDSGQNWALSVYGLIEVKNYLSTKVTFSHASNFARQALYYCALRKCNNFYMVINNSNIIVVNKYEITDEELENARKEMHEKANVKRLNEQVKSNDIV